MNRLKLILKFSKNYIIFIFNDIEKAIVITTSFDLKCLLITFARNENKNIEISSLEKAEVDI